MTVSEAKTKSCFYSDGTRLQGETSDTGLAMKSSVVVILVLGRIMVLKMTTS